jgi:hypothetical protein
VKDASSNIYASVKFNISQKINIIVAVHLKSMPINFLLAFNEGLHERIN